MNSIIKYFIVLSLVKLLITEIMNLSNFTILVTGVAGFIGSAVAKKLLSLDCKVLGIDNLNDYYSIEFKKDRIKSINEKDHKKKFFFNELSIEDNIGLDLIFKNHKPTIVVHLAAQAGVRYSISNPDKYIASNLVGFGNILEASRNYEIGNLIYASSSSVYGGNTVLPFSESQSVNHPISLYAATKISNELMAHAYSHLYNIPTTGLRFFTVYGPWGRPDMAPFIFSKSILENTPIDVFNFGKMSRDFTYIDDIVEAILNCCKKPATKDIEFDTKNPKIFSSFAPYRIFNVGNNNSVPLMYFIQLLEENLGKKAIVNYKPLQDGDVVSTYADLENIRNWIGFKPLTSIEEGVKKFSLWFKNYFKNQQDILW